MITPGKPFAHPGDLITGMPGALAAVALPGRRDFPPVGPVGRFCGGRRGVGDCELLAGQAGLGLGWTMSGMWTTPEDDPRSYGNPVGEKATYREYLGNYRLTIEMKCEGLDAGQLARRSVPPSTLSLLGLVRHLAQVENHWFQRVLQGRTGAPRLYKREDDPDWDFAGAVPDPGVVKDALATWKAEIARADEWLDALEENDLGREVPAGDGSVATRDVLVHVIEEYARHAGHADLLRECIDGRTGQ